MAGSAQTPPDALALVGLLADPARRAVFAALVLGATSLDEVTRSSGLSATDAASALGRLVSGGLVESIDGSPHLLAEAFTLAARRGHEAVRAEAGPRAVPAGVSPEAAKVFAAFVVEGRITAIPAARGKRLVLLDWLAQFFEPGRRYSEPMVNLVIGQRHADTAAWRRYLVDEGFLDRADGEYWRSGGTVSAAGS